MTRPESSDPARGDNALTRLLQRVLTVPPDPVPLVDVEAWWARHHEAASGLAHPAAHPVDRAIAAGFAADRPAYAFASGYQEALRLLLGAWPGVSGGRTARTDDGDPVARGGPRAPAPRIALCATEDGGNHPRAIHTRLVPAPAYSGEGDSRGYVLDGRKRWTTLGEHAHELLIFASEGVDEDGRNRLAAVRIPANRAGVTFEPMTGTAMVPEIPHAQCALASVRVEPGERLPGDGYRRYLVPFRTLEDICVHAALTAWHVQIARRAGWPAAILDQLVGVLTGLWALGRADPASPAVHVALAGVLAQSTASLGACDSCWDSADPEDRARWQRDRALLRVASAARERRRVSAERKLATGTAAAAVPDE